jgi:RHS repeat-associated protein
MTMRAIKYFIATALLCAAAGARAQVPTVDCAGTLVSWSYSYPWYAENCHCVAPDAYPVCNTGGLGTGGSDTSLPGQGGYYEFNRLSLFGAESGNSFFTLRYGDSFRDWSEEARARWQSYLIRNRLAKAGITVWPDNPAAALIEWFYKVFKGLESSSRPAALFNNLDGSPVENTTAEFESNYVDPEVLKKDDPVLDLQASEVTRLESVEEDLGGMCAPPASMAPGFRLNYSSLRGGQYETAGLKIEVFPDGRAVFTDSSNTRWPFRPYGSLPAKGDHYYSPPRGSVYRLVYGDIKDGRGYRVESADGDTIEFSPAGGNKWRPARYNAADGSWLTYGYNERGLARITDMHGRYFAFERDARGLPLSVTDQNGKKTSFAYDAAGRATEVVSPDGFRKRFGYDGAGLLASVKSGTLAEERYTYDAQGRVLSLESEGGVNRLEHYYNDAASRTVVTDALGSKTSYTYKTENGRKLTTSVTDALGGVSTLGYDGNYNVAVATDALGRATRYARNANGDPEAVTDALGNTSRLEYQVKLEYADASGPKTDYYSRPVKITDEQGRVTKLDYDSYGNLSKAEDALGNKTGMKYDKAGHLLELRDAVGSTYKYEYGLGLTKSVDPLGRVTRYQRDADLRVTVLTDPLGRNTSFTYDLSGNVTAAANPAGFVTKFAYGLGGCPSCAGGQLSALTDPKGNTWSFDHDQYGRLAGTANPLGQKKTYGYDKMSRVTELTDPAGNVTSYTYDALNRLARKAARSPSGERAVNDYSYDAVGNLLKAANGEGAVSYTYDALNRVLESRQAFGGAAHVIAYAYDAVGNRTAMKTPWGDFSYAYDALNRLAGILNPQGITVNFKYDAAGRRVKKAVFKNAPSLLAETDYAYDAAGQLLSITNKAGGKVVAFNNYEYDLAGNRVQKEDQEGVTRYGYDKSNRLITVEPVPMVIPKAEAFIYDKNGNRRFDKGAKDYKYDAANRLQENTVYAYTHDQNGNLTSRTHKASTTTVTYAYNLEQQLAEVITPEHKLICKYDPLGRRLEKSVNGSPVRYVYDNEDIIAMLDGEGKVQQTFTHGPGIDEPLIMTKADGANYYYHADGLASIRALTGDNAQIVETYSYKAYGQPTIKDRAGAVFDKSTVGNPYLFTARELDSESGLYYYRARYYDWQRGAFTQEDPIGFEGGVNLYIYVANNPLIFTDAFGEAVDIDVFVRWLINNAHPPFGKGQCASHVRQGLNAGGLNTDGHPGYAKEYGPFLVKNGFMLVSPLKYVPQKGDIVVFQPGSEYGHIQVWSGREWVSDHVQRKFIPWRSEIVPGPHKIYRQRVP